MGASICGRHNIRCAEQHITPHLSSQLEMVRIKTKPVRRADANLPGSTYQAVLMSEPNFASLLTRRQFLLFSAKSSSEHRYLVECLVGIGYHSMSEKSLLCVVRIDMA